MQQLMTGSLAGCRVLVVEDEFYIAADVTDALTALGAEIVGPVATQGEALALVAGPGRIGLAVLDINLQGETVEPVADLLTQHGIPFVFATGYDREILPRRFRDVPRWEKPFDATKLALALPALLVRA